MSESNRILRLIWTRLERVAIISPEHESFLADLVKYDVACHEHLDRVLRNVKGGELTVKQYTHLEKLEQNTKRAEISASLAIESCETPKPLINAIALHLESKVKQMHALARGGYGGRSLAHSGEDLLDTLSSLAPL